MLRPAAAAVTFAVLCACGSTNRPRDRSPAAEAEPSTRPAERAASASPGTADGPSPGASPSRRAASKPAADGGARGAQGGVPPVVPPSHGPIKLGLLYAVNDGAASAGIDNGNTIDLKRTVRAFVTSYNRTGGVAGRRIEPVYAELHSASHDFEQQVQAACATFTQDNHVAAVLNNVGYYSENLLSCLHEARVPLVSGDWVGPDRRDASRYPLFVTPAALVGDTRVAAVVTHLKSSGFLKTANRIGVIVEDCPVDQRIYKDGLVPALKDAGLTLATTFAVKCFRSIQDYGEQTSQMSGAVLAFRQSTVDRVVIVSQGAEANLLFAFSEVAEAQRYYPGYAVSSTALPAALALNAAAGQLANMQGLGWLPAVDTQDLKQAPPTSTAQACLDRMEREGIRPASNTDHVYVQGPCDAFALYDALLRATNGEPNHAAIAGAVGRVANGYVSAGTVNGHVSVTNGGRLSPASARLFAYATDQGFRYTGPAFPLSLD